MNGNDLVLAAERLLAATTIDEISAALNNIKIALQPKQPKIDRIDDYLL